ncbi:DUF4037 domain-containing protein [Bacillus lacus]|uniref:DUF4037 domain-containing protein n=1 Tax=Metabacillus lacus TaxID=1983721 RepID=A0A7X2IZ19_9BACI|nr:DUF4037 domain-containing protein [Metabacillus lacus]MRX72117.1 DUF4037 domain-containing protein [Metabacillus lacus]
MNLPLLAKRAASIYQENSKVEAVLLGGSVSRNWHDSFSDIELFIFWKQPPSAQDRKAPIEKMGGKMIDFHPYEDEEWSETYLTQGVKLEISNFLTTHIHKILDDVVLSYETDLDKQCIAAAIHDGVSLSGEEVLRILKNKVSEYPKELSMAMIEENADLGNRWNNREALLKRQDWLMLYKVMVDVQTKIMGMLFGLNNQYVHHPAFKWQKQTLNSMKVVPEHAADRLHTLFSKAPDSSIKELEAFLQDLYNLISKEYPHIDLEELRKQLLFLRPKH